MREVRGLTLNLAVQLSVHLMSDFTWKNLPTTDVESLSSDPSTYVRAIVVKKDWAKLLTIVQNPFYSQEVLKDLEIPFLRHNIFKSMDRDQIIQLLSQSSKVLINQFLLILIEEYDRLPVAEAVGVELYDGIHKNRKYSWASEHQNAINSLLPADRLKVLLNEMVKLGDARSSFVLPRQLFARKSFTKVVVEFYIECLNKYQPGVQFSQLEKLFSFAGNLLIHFYDNWSKEKQLKDLLKETVSAFPYYTVPSTSLLDSIARGNDKFIYDSSDFPLNFFIKHGLIEPKYLIEQTFKALLEEMKSETNKIFTTAFVQRIISIYSCSALFKNLLRTLRSLSIEEPDHQYAKIWPYLISNLLISMKSLTNHDQLAIIFDTINSYESLLLHDEIIKAISDYAEMIFESKETLIKQNMNLYTQKLENLFHALTHGSYNTPYNPFDKFFLLPSDLRDKILFEMIKYPTNDRPLNANITNQPTTTILNVVLYITDLKKIAQILGDNSGKIGYDNNGFLPKYKLNLPALPSSSSKKGDEWEGPVHIFERYLFKNHLLQNAEVSTVQSAYLLYKHFVFKVLRQAVNSNDISFLKNSADLHYRLCRYLLGKQKDELADFAISEFISIVCHPLALQVGYLSDKNFAISHFEKLINHIPIMPKPKVYPLYNICKILLYKTQCDVLPQASVVAAAITSKVLDKMASKIPSDLDYNMGHFNDTLYQYNNESNTRIDALFEEFDSKHGYLCPKPYREMILKNPRAKKACNQFIVPPLNPKFFSEEFKKKKSNQYEFRYNPQAIYLVLQRVSNYVNKYEDSMFNDPISKFVFNVLYKQFLKVLFDTNITSYFKGIRPSNLERYAKRHTASDYEQDLSKLGYTGYIAKGIVELCIESLNDSNLLKNVLKLGNPEEIFLSMEKISNWKLVDPKKINPNTVGITNPLIYSYSIVCNADEEVKANINILHKEVKVNPPKMNQARNNTKKKEMKKWMYSFALAQMEPYIKADPDKISKALIESPQVLLKFIGNSLKFCPYLPQGEYVFNIYAHILKLIIDDIAMPEPDQNDVDAKLNNSLFSQHASLIPNPPVRKSNVKRGGRFKRGQAQIAEKQVGLQKYYINVYIISQLTKLLIQEPRIKFDASILHESLFKLVEIPPRDLATKLGLDNRYAFVSRFSDFMVKLVDFGDDIKPKDWAKNLNSPIFKVFFKLLEHDVFHHTLVDSIQTLMLMTPSYKRKHALLTGLISAYYLENQYTMHFRTHLIMWILCPQIVGYPLPQFTIDFLKEISHDPSLHVDVKRSIVSSSVAYFQYQENSKVGPNLFDELFAIMDTLYNSSKDSMLPTFARLIDNGICETAVNTEGKLFQEILSPQQTPSHYVVLPVSSTIDMPRKDEWKKPYEKMVANFIGTGLIKTSSKITQLTIRLLKELCTRGGEVNQIVIPYLTDSMNLFEPSSGFVTIIGFAFSFCYLPSNESATKMIDTFCSIFERTRKFMDMKFMSKAESLLSSGNLTLNIDDSEFEPLPRLFNEFIDGVSSIFAKLSEDYKQLAWGTKLSARIIEIFEGQSKPAIQLEKYVEFIDILHIFASKEMITIANSSNDEEKNSNVIRLLNSLGQKTGLINNFIESLTSKQIKLTLNNLKVLAESTHLLNDRKRKYLINRCVCEAIKQLNETNKEEFEKIYPKIFPILVDS